MKGTGGRTRATCAIAVTARQNAAIATGADTPPPAAPPTPGHAVRRRVGSGVVIGLVEMRPVVRLTGRGGRRAGRGLRCRDVRRRRLRRLRRDPSSRARGAGASSCRTAISNSRAAGLGRSFAPSAHGEPNRAIFAVGWADGRGGRPARRPPSRACRSRGRPAPAEVRPRRRRRGRGRGGRPCLAGGFPAVASRLVAGGEPPVWAGGGQVSGLGAGGSFVAGAGVVPESFDSSVSCDSDDWTSSRSGSAVGWVSGSGSVGRLAARGCRARAAPARRALGLGRRLRL